MRHTNSDIKNISYKPLAGYYLLICVICSFSFSIYSFIEIIIDPIFIESYNEKNIKYYNLAFTINTLAVASAGQYIFIIFLTLCNVFKYNTSRILYNIFHYNYVIINLISFIIFATHINSFNFFKKNYNYYFISLLTQFTICIMSIILELFVCCCYPKRIHYIRIPNKFNVDNDADEVI
jgi:hypothetical protein